MYYGQSATLEKLKLYSALLLLLLTIGALVYFYLRTSQIAVQNKLWTGMAKTAHQLGTPLSSLMGWVSILKSKGIEEKITTPMRLT